MCIFSNIRLLVITTTKCYQRTRNGMNVNPRTNKKTILVSLTNAPLVIEGNPSEMGYMTTMPWMKQNDFHALFHTHRRVSTIFNINI